MTQESIKTPDCKICMVAHDEEIHAATLNHDPLNRTRLSTDIRFQRVNDDIDQRWANNWIPGDNL